MFDGRFRHQVERAIRPIGMKLGRTRLTPDHLTLVGLVVACASAVAIGLGELQLGFVLLVLSALPDLLDGALAKASDLASQRGAFFDSVIDRISDAVVLGGVAWYFAVEMDPRTSLIPFAVMGFSLLISYERAKAESLGLQAKGGLMERAERIVVLCVGLLFGSILLWVMWLMLVLTAYTAVQRFIKVWRQAAVAPVTAERIAVRRSRRASRRARRDDYRARFNRRRQL